MDLSATATIRSLFYRRHKEGPWNKIEGWTPFKTLLAILEPLLAILNFAGGASFKAGDQVPPALLGWYYD